MNHESTARLARLGQAARAAVHGLVGAALSIALSGCGSDDRPTPSEAQGAPTSTAMEAPGAPSPGAGGTNAVENGVAPSSALEGQQPSSLAMPGVGGTSGQSTPNTVDPAGMEGSGEDPLAAVPSAGCGKARSLQDGSQALSSGGVNRTFYLATPSGYDSSYPHRVVFMFHWNYGSINAIVNPPDADQNTDRPFYGMGDLTDDKTIFVVPQGLISPSGGAGWENPNDRDVIFTDDLLAAVSADLCIDTSRVFTTGFSYGAAMSYKLACVRPDKFRAAAVYAAGPVSGNNPAECTTPIALFQVHGVDDPIINISTGLSVLDVFTRLNGCAAMPPPEPPQDGHTCTSYEGCQLPTRFCSFGSGENNPHNPSLRGHYPSAKAPGESTSWIPAEAWSFITQF